MPVADAVQTRSSSRPVSEIAFPVASASDDATSKIQFCHGAVRKGKFEFVLLDMPNATYAGKHVLDS